MTGNADLVVECGTSTRLIPRKDGEIKRDTTTRMLRAVFPACTRVRTGPRIAIPVLPSPSRISFAFTYILRLRSRSSIGAFLISPLPPVLSKVVTDSRAASLHRRYPASSVVPAPPPPSRLSADFPVSGYTAYPAPPISRPGRGGLLQLLNASSSPCRRYHHAGVTQRLSQFALRHAAFIRITETRPPGHVVFVATCAFALATAR